MLLVSQAPSAEPLQADCPEYRVAAAAELALGLGLLLVDVSSIPQMLTPPSKLPELSELQMIPGEKAVA
jgi:hypothetical protein